MTTTVYPHSNFPVLISLFNSKGATKPEKAIALSKLDLLSAGLPINTPTFIKNYPFIVNIGGDRFYLDENLLDIYMEKQKKILKFALILLIAMVAFGLTFSLFS